MICWIVARWPDAACRNSSSAFRLAFTASAHSVDRNGTGTAARLPRSARSAPERWLRASIRAGPQPPSARSRSSSRRANHPGSVRCDASDRNQASRSAPADHDRVEARVLGQEEHVLVADAEDVAEVGVDHAPVRDDDDVAVAVRRDDRLDRIDASALEVVGRLAAGGAGAMPGPGCGTTRSPRDAPRRSARSPSPPIRRRTTRTGLRARGSASPTRSANADGGLAGAQSASRSRSPRAWRAAPAVGEPLGLLETHLAERRVVLQPPRRSRPARRSSSPAARAGSGRDAGRSCRASSTGRSRRTASRPGEPATPRRRPRRRRGARCGPDASDVIGSGKDPRSM